jgi:hypothetical protein
MALDPQLKRQFRQTAYVAEPNDARDARGQSTYGAAAARLVRWEANTKLVRNAQGEEVESAFWMACEAAVSLLARVWGPDDGNGSDATKARTPIAVEPMVDEVGNVSHYEVYL